MGVTTIIVIGAIAVRLAIYLLGKDGSLNPNRKAGDVLDECAFIREPVGKIGTEMEPLVIGVDANSTTKLIANNNENWNCYFGDSYYEMRDNFRSAAATAGLTVHSYPLPSDPELTTDVVVLEGSAGNDNVILHISGTHGPEGYSGSATQLAFLRQYALCRAAEGAADSNTACALGVTSAEAGWPTIVMVHAHNAYGFAHNRRFTRENIDLNRNFLTEEQFKAVGEMDHNHAGYVTLDPIINPTSPPLLRVPDSPFNLESLATFPTDNPIGVRTNDGVEHIRRANAAADAAATAAEAAGILVRRRKPTPPSPARFSPEWRLLWRIRLTMLVNEGAGYVKVAFAVLRYGLSTMKRALVSGNYYKPSGVYYGGGELCESAVIMRQIAEEHLHSRRIAMGQEENSSEGTCPAALTAASSCPRVAVIDVHTGLGVSGVDTIVVENGGDQALFDQLFPVEIGEGREYNRSSSMTTRDGKKLTSKQRRRLAKASKYVTGGVKDTMGGGGALSGYDAMKGGVCNGFVKNMLLPGVKRDEILCMTQEFGTAHMVMVGQAVAQENYAHHHGSDIEKEVYGEVVKRAFFVNTAKWKRSVVRRGLSVLMQAVHSFAKPQ